MLPGFRFLFAATVLSMSILIFGLGAAALLRAAHEEIANTPSWRPGPEPKFAQPSEAAAPVLALLRVDPAPAEPKVSEDAPVAADPEPPVAAMPAEPDKIAALKPEDPPPLETAKLPETAKSDIAVPEIPMHQDTPPAQADAPAAAEPTRMAATEQVLPPVIEAAPAAAEQASTPASAETDLTSVKDLATKDLSGKDLATEGLAAEGLASMKIATLGGPPVTIEAPPAAKAAGAKPGPSVAQQRLQAKRVKERRRLAQRARQAAAE